MVRLMNRLLSIGTDRGLWPAAGVAAVLAGIANTILFLIGRAAGADFTVNQGGSVTQVLAVQPFVASVIGVGGGALVAMLLRRLGRAGLWTPIAGAVGVLSTAAPLTQGIAGSTKILLALMHLIALGITVLVLRPVVAAAPAGG